MRLIVFVLSVFLVLPGCIPEDQMPSDFVTPTVTPSKPPQIVVPSGAAATNIFGISYSSTGSMNPITGNSKLNMEFMPLLYEGLYALDDHFNAQPLLCERLVREENAYLIYLKNDVLFSDGSELTAADVKYSFELASTPGTIYADRMQVLSSITVLDQKALRIELSRSIGRLEQLLDIPIIKKDSGSQQSPLGTGPYVFVETEDESYLKASPNWWQKKPKPATRIELVDVPEADLLINYFETGAVSMVGNDPTATDPVVFGGDYEEWSYPTSILYYLGINTMDKPLSNVAVRRAISFAVDRSFIAETEMLRYADPAILPINPVNPQYNEELADQYAFSLTTFAEKLEEAGYNAEKPLEVDLIVNSENTFKSSVAGRVAEDLRTMGVLVNLRELKWADYLSALKNRDFDLYLAEVKLNPIFDLSPILSKDGALNYGKYASDEMQIKLDAYLSADSDSAVAASSALYQQIVTDAPIIPILFKRGAVMAKRGVLKEIEPVQSNIFRGIRK